MFLNTHDFPFKEPRNLSRMERRGGKKRKLVSFEFIRLDPNFATKTVFELGIPSSGVGKLIIFNHLAKIGTVLTTLSHGAMCCDTRRTIFSDSASTGEISTVRTEGALPGNVWRYFLNLDNRMKHKYKRKNKLKFFKLCNQ